MSEVERHPRVLIVVMPKVKADDSANLLIRTEFGNWPKGRLAQIYSNESPGRGEFCGRYYQLQARDRVLGKLFMRLRARVSRMVAMGAVTPSPISCPRGLLRRGADAIQKRLGDLLIRSGVWEAVFRVRISRQLAEFVQDFRPEIIYCSGYSLAFAELPLLIADRFNVPICFQTLEDWPLYSYGHSPVGALLRRQATRLIRRAALRLAFGETMKGEYERRYGVPFHVTYHLDDARRFTHAGPQRVGQTKRIVFTGSLVLNRHEGIEDLLRAIRVLQQEGLRVDLHVYCTGVPKEVSDEVRSIPAVTFLPLPSHDDLPRVLQNADVLFLPEAFSVDARRLGMAISTKCHLYMMAERPILAYGPSYGGTMEYARQQGWALVVQQRDIRALTDGLRQLLSDRRLGAMLTRHASECFLRNHNLKDGRRRFEQLVAKSVACGPTESSSEGSVKMSGDQA
jgi:glycosyltransferase involved in cell wall biosynthesis